MRTQASKAPSGSRHQAWQGQQPGELSQQVAGQQGVAAAPSTTANAKSAQAAGDAGAHGAASPGSGPGPCSAAAAEGQLQGGQHGEQPLALPNQHQPDEVLTGQAPPDCAETQVVLPTLGVALPLQPSAGVAHALPATALVTQAGLLPAKAAVLPSTAAAGSQLPLLPPTQELLFPAADGEQAVPVQGERQPAAVPTAAAATANAEAEEAAAAAAVAAGMAAAAVAAALASAEAGDSRGATAGAQEPAARQTATLVHAAAQQPGEEQQQQEEEEEAAVDSGRRGGGADLPAPTAAPAGAEDAVQAAGGAPAEAGRDVEMAEVPAEPAGGQGQGPEVGPEPQAVEVRAPPAAGQAAGQHRTAAATPASPDASAAAGAESKHCAAASTPVHMPAPAQDAAGIVGTGSSSEPQGEDSGTGGSYSGSSSEEEGEEGSPGEAGEAVPPSPLCTADELAVARQQEREALLARHCTQSPSGGCGGLTMLGGWAQVRGMGAAGAATAAAILALLSCTANSGHEQCTTLYEAF